MCLFANFVYMRLFCLLICFSIFLSFIPSYLHIYQIIHFLNFLHLKLSIYLAVDVSFLFFYNSIVISFISFMSNNPAFSNSMIVSNVFLFRYCFETNIGFLSFLPSWTLTICISLYRYRKFFVHLFIHHSTYQPTYLSVFSFSNYLHSFTSIYLFSYFQYIAFRLYSSLITLFSTFLSEYDSLRNASSPELKLIILI